MRYAVPDQIVTILPDDDSVIGCRQVEREHGSFNASDPYAQVPSDGRDSGRWHSRASLERPICLLLSGRGAGEYRRSRSGEARADKDYRKEARGFYRE